MLRRIVIPIFCLSFGPGNVRIWAGLVPIEPFSGVLSETWESFPTTPKGDHLPDPTNIMQGGATISNQQMLVFEPSTGAGFGLGTSGLAVPSDGLKAMGIELPSQITSVEFALPVVKFGSYWGAITLDQDPQIGDPAFIGVSFYDSFDVLIVTETFPYSRSQFGDGLLEWHGWSSTVPIKRITYTEDRVVVDGLQADPVPEPASIAILGLAALLFIKPRRK